MTETDPQGTGSTSYKAARVNQNLPTAPTSLGANHPIPGLNSPSVMSTGRGRICECFLRTSSHRVTDEDAHRKELEAFVGTFIFYLVLFIDMSKQLRDRDANAQDPYKVTAAIADPSAAPPVLPGSPTATTANTAPVCTVHANAQDPDKVTVAITDPSEGASAWAGLRHAEMLRLPYWDETRMATMPALPWYFTSGG
ncbi:hypothetical protein B0H14DRAFT_2589700 [Mycena olivaceomarginata]|nr:hypothetical protein B0H14DRAFT_2589700 [Mycena olivaceomarginata]